MYVQGACDERLGGGAAVVGGKVKEVGKADVKGEDEGGERSCAGKRAAPCR